MRMKHSLLAKLIFVIVFAIIIISGLEWWQVKAEKKAISLGEVCGNFTSANSGWYTCCKDCEMLQLEYFRYERSSSLFGASIKNCYCKENNEVNQIW